MNAPESVRAYFSELGKRSRAAQLAKSTPEQRTAQARKAANARWSKNQNKAQQ